MKIVIFGDFQICGYSKDAKDRAQTYRGSHPGTTVQTKQVSLSALRSFKDLGIDELGSFEEIMKGIRRSKKGRGFREERLTFPVIFIGGQWLPEGASGFEGALRSVKPIKKKIKRRRARSRSKSRSKPKSRSKSKSTRRKRRS